MGRLQYKWVALALLWVAYFLVQGTRQIYGATLPMIRADLDVDDVRMGAIASAFFFAYAMAVPFGGFVADFFRRKWVIVVGTALFASGIFAASFASTVGMLLLTYGIVNGIGQSFVPTTSTSVIQQLHADSRATALSIYQLGLYAGVILCSVSAGWIGSLGQSAWRMAFRIFGGFALVWVVVLVLFLHDTPPIAAVGQERARMKDGFLALLSKPSAILMMLAFGLSNFGDTGLRIWAPTFMMRYFDGFTPAMASFHAVFWFYVGAFVGILVGGRISDALKRHGRLGARLDCNFTGLVLSAPLVFLAIQASGGIVVFAILMTAFGFVHGFYDANFIASFYEVITPRYRTAAYGLFAGGAFAIISFAPAVLGWIGSIFSLRTALSSLVFFYLAAAIVTLVARWRFFQSDYEQ